MTWAQYILTVVTHWTDKKFVAWYTARWFPVPDEWKKEALDYVLQKRNA